MSGDPDSVTCHKYWLGRDCPICNVEIDSGSIRYNGYALAHKNPQAHPQAGHHVIPETIQGLDEDSFRTDGGERGARSASERERHDECPDCGTIGHSGWVLGHHYCPECDHTFGDGGEKICEGRYIDNRGADSE